MPKYRRSLVIAAALALLTLILAVGYWRQRSISTPPVLGVFRLGERIRSKVELNLQFQMNRGSEQAMQVLGQLSVTPVDIHDGVVEVAYELKNVQTNLKGANGAAASGQMEAEKGLSDGLSHRFYVRHRADGAATAIHFERGYNPTFANVLLTLATTAQYVNGAKDENSWTAVERDSNGEYLALYARTSAEKVTKRKPNYLSTGNPGGAAPNLAATPTVHVEQAAYEFVTNAQGRMKEMAGHERVQVAMGAVGLQVTLDVTLKLFESQTEQDSSAIGDYSRQKAEFITQPIEAISTDESVRHAHEDQRVLQGATLDMVWAELVALDNPTDSAKSAPVVRRLEAQFRTDETSIVQTVARLSTVPEQKGKIAVDALSLAGTEATQNALAEIAVNDKLATLCREYAIQYLAHQKKPTTAGLSALSKLIDDADAHRRTIARFAYGAVASKLADKQPEQTQSIVRELLVRLERAGTDSERGDLYLALGNSASAATLPALRDASKTGKGILRSTAIEALGHVNDPSVVPELLEYLKNAETAVRMAALNGIQRREIGPFLPALVEVVQHDPSADVRSSAAELLGGQVQNSPPLRAVLEQCATKDPEPKVRQAAARALPAPSRSPDPR